MMVTDYLCTIIAVDDTSALHEDVLVLLLHAKCYA